jgi:hypothetical protein
MIEYINELIKEGESYTFENNSFKQDHGIFSRPSEEFLAWIATTEDFILKSYGKDSSPYRLFDTCNTFMFTGHYKGDFNIEKAKLIASLKSCIRIPPIKKPTEQNTIASLNNLFEKFHTIAKQLRHRYNNRPTLEVEDEYDVQDLLHSLLKLHFNDIRTEEWTPSYAGGCSRMDFLLKVEQIVIETKKTRKSLGDKELGKELIIDKEKYKSHPDCKILICFIYDPEGRITNPKGLQNDLNKNEENFTISIVIKPQ